MCAALITIGALQHQVTPWFRWFTGSGGYLVYVVHWLMQFTGSGGSLVQGVIWFMQGRRQVCNSGGAGMLLSVYMPIFSRKIQY